MQPVQLQKDKLHIIEWIKQLEDSSIIEHLELLMASRTSGGYTLTEERKMEVRERSEKYYMWEEVKERAIKKFDEKNP